MSKEIRCPELNPPDFSHNHHGEYYSDGMRGILGTVYSDLFIEKDSLGRCTSAYHRKVNEWQWDDTERQPDRYSDTYLYDLHGGCRVKKGISGNRLFIIEYDGDSNRPKYVWNRLGAAYDGDWYEFFGFTYHPNGDLKAIDFWGQGGNMSGHYEYSVSQKRVKTYIDKKKEKDVTSTVVKINGHVTNMTKLPDPTNWRIFLSRHAYKHQYSDAADALGLDEDTMCYLPKRRMTKKEREWSYKHSAAAQMIRDMDKLNKGII